MSSHRHVVPGIARRVVYHAALAGNLREEEITTPGARDHRARVAQLLVCWMLSEMGYSYASIGRFLGVDDTTVRARAKDFVRMLDPQDEESWSTIAAKEIVRRFFKFATKTTRRSKCQSTTRSTRPTTTATPACASSPKSPHA